MSDCVLQGAIECELFFPILKIPLLYVILPLVLIRPICMYADPFYEKQMVGFPTNTLFQNTLFPTGL